MEALYINPAEELTDIQKFYNRKTIFMTGGTGFLGNILIDKLMRSCPGIKNIYILTREKKGKDPNERFKAMFDNISIGCWMELLAVTMGGWIKLASKNNIKTERHTKIYIFERMKNECPDYLSRIVPIIGDCQKPNLGINENDRNTIITEVEVIFHVAATVRFDAHIRDAVNINIRAINDLLEIAHSMKQLKAFVHVSTAYSNCAERKIVGETFYNAPIEPSNLIKVTESLSDDVLARLTPKLITPWPNTYAFTKSIAENVVRTKGKGIPSTIVRPAIVIATASEPIIGWINNFYGPTGVVAAAGLGLLRTINVDGDCIADLVPCDSVVNAIIAAAWDISVTWVQPKENVVEEKQLVKDYNEIPIYNYVSSNSNPLTWKDFMHYNESYGHDIPSPLAIWVYCLTLNKYKFMHQIYCIFLHLLPALIVDTCAKLLGKKPKLWAAYEKIHKFSDVISYFSTQQWTFDDSNTMNLFKKLSSRDKEIFNFDLSTLDWNEYFYHHVRGIRVYLINDKLDTVKEGIAKRNKMQIAHNTMKILFYCFVFSILYQFIKWIW